MSKHLLQDLARALNWTSDPPIRWTQGLSTQEMDKIASALGLDSWCGTAYREDMHSAERRFIAREPRASSCVINTAPQGQVKGEHWVCLYYDPSDPELQHHLEFFDPAGLINHLPSVTCVMENLSPFHPVVQNQTPIQDIFDPKSPACGYHCLYYVMCKDSTLPLDTDQPLDASNVGQLAYPDGGRFSHVNDVHAMTVVEGFIKNRGLVL